MTSTNCHSEDQMSATPVLGVLLHCAKDTDGNQTFYCVGVLPACFETPNSICQLTYRFRRTTGNFIFYITPDTTMFL
ncbi:UNVERIFIED_CONTAM: hypothetical protein FKN15_019314 [Acipenser sinensis]